MNIHVKIHRQYILDSPMHGTSFDAETQIKVDLLQGYVSNMYKYGVRPTTGTEWTNVELVNGALSDFDFDHFNLIMSLEGSEITGFSPLVKLPISEIDNPTPVGLICSIKPILMSSPILEEDYTGDDYATYVETFVSVELEPARQKTWSEWVGVRLYPRNLSEIEGYYYFGAHLGKSAIEVDKKGVGTLTTGHALTGTELMVILAAGFELVLNVSEIEIESF